ncbi:hypothetical protein ILUMI_16498 [Ignelater luminosus]|uniref:Uncharacterized protein n=1 Tax=Ignelater luminosus TaxID=2038154 RepID=A0A8K0CUB2_IGNLU|nr:hypothetical protein ILUMI_16498 [Ignelater luminosus]
MQKAIDAVNNKEMAWLRASKTFVVGVYKGLGHYQIISANDLETDPVNRIKEFERNLFGLTLKDVLRGLRKRQLELALRQSEATSLGRAQAFNKPQVILFFKKLQEAIAVNDIQPTRIWNVDESVPPALIFARLKMNCLMEDQQGLWYLSMNLGG